MEDAMTAYRKAAVQHTYALALGQMTITEQAMVKFKNKPTDKNTMEFNRERDLLAKYLNDLYFSFRIEYDL